MGWVKTLVAVHNSIKVSTRNWPTQRSAWRTLYTQLEQLHWMVYLLGSYYDAILRLQGMVNFLQENLQGNYVANADGTPLLSDADADGSEADRADTLSDIGSDGREPAGQILLRYFRAIVAWNQAYAWLESSKVFRSPRGALSLNIVKIQVLKLAAAPIRMLLDEFLETYNGTMRQSQEIRSLEQMGDDFKGTVHAEAILMALIKECSSRLIVLVTDGYWFAGCQQDWCGEEVLLDVQSAPRSHGRAGLNFQPPRQQWYCLCMGTSHGPGLGNFEMPRKSIEKCTVAMPLQIRRSCFAKSTEPPIITSHGFYGGIIFRLSAHERKTIGVGG